MHDQPKQVYTVTVQKKKREGRKRGVAWQHEGVLVRMRIRAYSIVMLSPWLHIEAGMVGNIEYRLSTIEYRLSNIS